MSQREKSFTIRLPEDLVDQIDMRCVVNYRSRTKEIQALLTHAIDSVTTDHKAGLTQVGTKKIDQT